MNEDIVKTVEVPTSIFIEGRIWVDKTYGNSYFTARLWVNGKIVETIPFTYGYDLQYLHTSLDRLQELGYINSTSVPELRDEKGIHFYHVATYGKKSELFKAAN